MGCCISKSKVEDKYKMSPLVVTVPPTIQKTQSRIKEDRPLKSHTSTIYRKKYKQFLEEYEVLDFLGKGGLYIMKVLMVL